MAISYDTTGLVVEQPEWDLDVRDAEGTVLAVNTRGDVFMRRPPPHGEIWRWLEVVLRQWNK